ncbi:DNA polymerase Y family protein [Ottowia sp. GY511]|nr:DNA polymerase Y family protein [Ottowia sp. GY511]
MLATTRRSRKNGAGRTITAVLLDSLPLECLTAASRHSAVLARLGCRTLGDVRKLPRGGMARRFDAALLESLDRAYGLRPDSYEWLRSPDTFEASLELMSRVETAPALLFGARRLLLQLSGWLSARRSGVMAFTLHWAHDAMRSRETGEGGARTVRTAQTTRNIEHLSRLLAEQLAKVRLEAPVGDLRLTADEVHPLIENSASLLPDPQEKVESLALALERIAARLGPDRVRRPRVRADHRSEWMGWWQACEEPMPRTQPEPPPVPQPTFLLPEPLELAVKANRPLYQGPLQLLVGPHRVEGGWWHRSGTGAEAQSLNVARDYWVALSAHAGVLWVFQTRLAGDQGAWFLHGVFA